MKVFIFIKRLGRPALTPSPALKTQYLPGSFVRTSSIVPRIRSSQRSQSRTAFCDGHCRDQGDYCHLRSLFANFRASSLCQNLLKSSVMFTASAHLKTGKNLGVKSNLQSQPMDHLDRVKIHYKSLLIGFQ